MCGPTVPWDWVIIDLSYVLVLIGGGMIFRARNVGLATWGSFAVLSTVVGAFLMYATYAAHQAFQQGQADAFALVASGFAC